MSKNFPNFTPLNSFQIKFIKRLIEDSYGFNSDILEKYSLYLASKGKVYMTTFDISKIEIPNINSAGIYFGSFHDNNRFRLSIEGSQMIKANKNYIVLKDLEALKSYLAAENLFNDDIKEINEDGSTPFLIVKFDEYNIGSVSRKEKYFLSYIPKSRKLDFNKVF